MPVHKLAVISMVVYVHYNLYTFFHPQNRTGHLAVVADGVQYLFGSDFKGNRRDLECDVGFLRCNPWLRKVEIGQGRACA